MLEFTAVGQILLIQIDKTRKGNKKHIVQRQRSSNIPICRDIIVHIENPKEQKEEKIKKTNEPLELSKFIGYDTNI
jgi:hypothetical protein